MDDRSRWPDRPHGQPGRPAPGRGNRPPRPGNGAPPPPRRTGGRAGASAPGGPPGGPERRPPRDNQPARPPERPARSPVPAAEPLQEDTWSRGRRGPARNRRGTLIALRALAALLSVVVLSTTGVAWGYLRNLNSGLSGSDVIGSGLSSPDGATDILLIGNDSRTDAQGNPLPEEVLKTLRTTDDEGGDLTDTMILMRIPNGGQRASAVSFPRDTMVDMGEYGENKLNSALSRAKASAEQELTQQGVTDPKELEKRSRAEGQKFLIQTIEQLAGVSIDHYAEVNLLGFHDITKAVGGVDVCLKNPVDDSDYSGAVFDAGPQTIAGADALAFVRQRHGLPRGDLDRVVRQQVFMSGLARKILSSGTLSNPSKLSSLMEALKKSVVLDQGWDVVEFAQQMQGIAGGNIEFQTAPVELVGESGSEEVQADPKEVQEFVDNLLLPPAERAAKEQAAAAAEERRSETTVDVYNASGVNGLASRVLSSLSDEGFSQGGSGNSENRSQSLVYHAAGDEAAAKDVSELLGGVQTEVSSNLSPGSIEVHLGTDYSGPGMRNLAGAQQLRLDGPQQQVGPMPKQQDSGEQTITADGVPCVN